ncbi:glycosyltransferase family 2 protein [Winogradskyella haliclonae]|uniref:Glycosyltransferase 2-like domain-containing protein n=1 Tax=Winogradskyella haliclonae TaxID=2048558 RepID=A0ABQ2C1E9_9FLAO|nr:glycosyltransferase family 2 protein [Winogradskyella haliclonae]GGI58040.1 hypothetical protein GCM10011444_23490 [Winogradskyella haliclonae]
MSLVSIIIPTYNRAHLITETLDSIKSQTHTYWECIIVDDNSTDNTKEVIENYSKNDARFIYAKRPQHMPKGANACRNYGFQLSKGDFINWFDSDDIMHENKLSVQLKSLEFNTESPYSICQSNWFDKESNKDLGLRSRTIDSKNRLEDYCLYNIVWLTTAPLWRKGFLEKYNLKFDEELHQSQEYDFHTKALYISDKYTIVKEPLLTLIKHNEAISNNIFQDFKIESNLKVKGNVTKDYLPNFTASGKLKWLEILTLYYKELLIRGKKEYAKKSIPLIFRSVEEVEISFISRLSFKLKIILTYMSFVFFGKGYKLVKPLT